MLSSIIALSAAALLGSCPDSRAEIDSFGASIRAARAHLSADGGALWGRQLRGEWVGFTQVSGAACAFASAPPAAAGFVPVRVRGGDTVWVGAIPAGINPANTSIRWAGRRWAGIILPLAADTAASGRLLIHELVHTLQPNGSDTAGTFLPRPIANEGGEGSDQLEGVEGRTLLRLELRALASALTADDDSQRRAAARDALRFRHVRYSRATDTEQQRQRGLDVSEGLAEYTGWRLATRAADVRRQFAQRLERAERAAGDAAGTTSFIRSFPYLTGPAYALLLDELAPGWRARVIADGAGADLQMMLATAIRLVPRQVSDPEAQDAAAKYDGRAIHQAELARRERIESARRALHARFVDGETLRLRPGALNVVFDPNGQTSLGGVGTVMRGFVWKGNDGAELRAPAGALVTADWQEIRVPLDSAALSVLAGASSSTAIAIEANGWTLRLPSGWQVLPEGTSFVVRPGG